jgi:hypothetical protein
VAERSSGSQRTKPALPDTPQVNAALQRSGQAEHFKAARREERLSRVEKIFADYQAWVRDTLTIEPVPFVQIIAVFTCDG